MAENKVGFSIVVIGGSAGSLEVILNMIGEFPQKTEATFVVVVHRKNYSESVLTELLATKTGLLVKEVEDKEPLVPGTIYIAPADYHLLIENENLFSLDSTEKVNHSRPSIDVTFESVALAFGKKVIGVLLSGANADGAAGLQKIKEHGGFVVVQEPSSAEVSYMPRQAILLGNIDAVLPAEELGRFVCQLLQD